MASSDLTTDRAHGERIEAERARVDHVKVVQAQGQLEGDLARAKLMLTALAEARAQHGAYFDDVRSVYDTPGYRRLVGQPGELARGILAAAEGARALLDTTHALRRWIDKIEGMTPIAFDGFSVETRVFYWRYELNGLISPAGRVGELRTSLDGQRAALQDRLGRGAFAVAPVGDPILEAPLAQRHDYAAGAAH
jgi:hypothetical protein